MKKLWMMVGVVALCGACSFHEKQPVDETYYKKTQGIAWPEKKVENKATAVKEKTNEAVKKVADKTAQVATNVADKATTVSKTITTTVSETTTYTK